jgi:hypothetical protein
MLSHKLTMLIHLFSGGFQNSKTRIAADNDERGTWLLATMTEAGTWLWLCQTDVGFIWCLLINGFDIFCFKQ